MDPTRFDTLARVLSQMMQRATDRRAMLGAFGGILLAERFETISDVEAKKRNRGRKKNRKKKKCLFGQRRCRDRRCHGCCGDADCGGNPCESGTCSDCPRNERVCRGGCIPEDTCCIDSECTGDRVCLDGTCGCRASERECNGACIPSDACCGTDCPGETCSPETCNGCCDGNTCRNGDSANFCGRGGVACVPCAQGESCDAGECRGSGNPTCGPENCNGCCDGTTCREGDSQNFCGRGGAACNQCEHGVICDAGHCGCRDDDDCDAGDSGLCRPNGRCVYAPDCLATGTSGTCGTVNCCSSNVFCSEGLPITCPQGVAGDSCHTNADCSSGACTFYVCE